MLEIKYHDSSCCRCCLLLSLFLSRLKAERPIVASCHQSNPGLSHQHSHLRFHHHHPPHPAVGLRSSWDDARHSRASVWIHLQAGSYSPIRFIRRLAGSLLTMGFGSGHQLSCPISAQRLPASASFAVDWKLAATGGKVNGACRIRYRGYKCWRPQ